MWGTTMDNWYIYLIDKKGNLYVGITTDLANRMRQHGMTNPLYFEGPMSKAEALKRERSLKGCRREKTLILIRDFSSQPSGRASPSRSLIAFHFFKW
jgi:predicted GIY-YIG superfamily endonuclease